MKKTAFWALMLGLALSASAQETMLEGFEYSAAPGTPDGTEWQSPQRLSLNKEQPRAWMFSFASDQEALKVLPYGSTYYRSLDGTWKFRWVAEPSQRDSSFWQTTFDDSQWDDIEVPGNWNVQGLRKDGTMKYGVPIYVNQKVIFQHRVAVGDWKGGVMRTPPTDWTTYRFRNEVGSYRRTFQVPAEWAFRDVYINFDGVDSFFYLWINGQYVGFSKNSRNTARFNITPYLNPYGENVVAVEVYRNSDGSLLEAQDMFRLPGIFRSTYLTANPQVEIRHSLRGRRHGHCERGGRDSQSAAREQEHQATAEVPGREDPEQVYAELSGLSRPALHRRDGAYGGLAAKRQSIRPDIHPQCTALECGTTEPLRAGGHADEQER